MGASRQRAHAAGMERTGNPQLFSEEPRPCAQAAILYAAGFDEAAAELLRTEIAAANSAGDPAAWRMLLELCRLCDRRDEFDRVVGAYRKAFGGDAPVAWHDATPIAVAGVVSLDGILASMPDVARVVEHARSRRMIALDFSEVRRITFSFAPELGSLFRVYGMQGKRMLLANVTELHAQLLETVGKGAEVVLVRRASMNARAGTPGAPGNPARPAPDLAIAA